MDTILGAIDVKEVFRFALTLEFGFIFIVALTGLFKLMHLNYEIRKYYAERITVFDTFFKVYAFEKQRIEDELEEKRARLENLRASRAENPIFNIPEVMEALEDEDL